MKLRAAEVEKVLRYCLYKNDEVTSLTEPPDDAVKVQGIIHNYAFHPGRLAEKKEDIRALLQQTPKGFHRGSGGGTSFLRLCVDRENQQWGEHHQMEALVCLAIGSGLGAYVAPREMWARLPGGVPYVVFDLRG